MIAGGDGGIGLTLAKYRVQNGGNVVIADVARELLERAETDIKALMQIQKYHHRGHRIMFLDCVISRPPSTLLFVRLTQGGSFYPYLKAYSALRPRS